MRLKLFVCVITEQVKQLNNGYIKQFIWAKFKRGTVVPTKSVVEPTIKESLAIEVIGASERTALIPLKENNVSTKYSELVKLGLENSANAKILKKQLDNNTILKAQELLKYLKDVNNCLGNSVNTSTFYELCRNFTARLYRSYTCSEFKWTVTY